MSSELDRRGQRHARGLEHGAGAAGSGGAQAKPSSGLVDVGLNELIEIALNAADEVAVEAFLDRKIPFNGIPGTIEKVLASTPESHPATIAEVLASDREARDKARVLIG